ncbi:syntaxin [Marasmius fiardii PR-910]|nr:syntaxin [Marasmius fiardii PR-910]
MSAIQAVHIVDHQERSKPKPHTVYRIQIQANVRSWTMWRRYSEFDDLNVGLTKATGTPPPLPLPPKHKFSVFRSHSDPKLLEERKVGLESYLRAIVSAKDDRWRETFTFKDFLGIPIGKQPGVPGGPPTQFSSTSWLEEHHDIQNRLRDVRADINKREALSDQGDINAAHKSNVAAKQKLAGVLSRIGNLGTGLRELAMTGLSEGELQRRTDMVARLQDECEKLGKMVSMARQQQQTNRNSVAFMTTAPAASDREALLEGNASTRVTRVFGAPVKPEETEETRPLDNQGVFSLQQTQMQRQDEQLSQLTTILRRQRHLGEAIYTEINDQIGILDDLSNEVDRTGDKLLTASKQLNRLG